METAQEVNLKQPSSQELLSLNKEIADLKFALDVSSIIAVTDVHGKIISVNKKFCELSKYREDELLGQDHRILNSGYHSKEFFQEMWKTIGSGHVWTGEIRNKAKDGSFYWVHTTIVPLLNEKQKPERYFSIRIDITEQKQISAELQKAIQANYTNTVKNLESKLEEKKWLYRSLYHHSQDAVFSFNPNGKIIEMNPAMEKLLGYSIEELRKKKGSQLIAEEYFKNHHNSFQKALNGELQNFEMLMYREDGEKIYVNMTYLPIIVDQQVTGIYAIGKDITEDKKAHELNAFLAKHDELTKLFNRRGLEEKLIQTIDKAISLNHKFAVMYMDLDRFKHINDTLGHYVGDRLLEKLAARLYDCIGSDNFLARMGGDEFMILMPEIKDVSETTNLANILLNSIKEPFFIEDHELYVTSSIGIGLYPDSGHTAVDLLKRADIALYKAKDQGRNNYQIYSATMDQMSFQSFILERDLRKAINQNEFMVYLQPRICTKSKEIIAAEALIRWNHPKFGLVPPSEFIPLAEETGLIVPIGKWMKQKVCELLVEWRNNGIPLIPISINISPRSFSQKGFADNLGLLLEKYGLEGNMLEVEITESSLMKNEEEVIQTISKLKKLGIKIYIDDFGTGYSSISYLKTFKLYGIKIDRSFIHNISFESENAGITTAMINMAHLLKMEVVAEGVETEEELCFLEEHQCNQVQGYLFGKPAPHNEFKKMIIRQRDNSGGSI